MSTQTGDWDPAEAAVRLSVALTRLRSRLREEAGMTSSGFTLSQLAILQRIIAEGSTTAASLAAVEHVSQQSIAQSVATLKAAKLVQTERDATDGRKILINVSATGRTFFDSLMASRKAWLVRAIDTTIGPTEHESLDTTITLLERLAAADPGKAHESDQANQ